MEFEIREAHTRDEFDAITEVIWTAMHEPFHPSFHWLHPVHGYTDEDRQAAIKADTDRRWTSHTNNDASHWFYVTAPDGTVCGVVQWQVYTTNPFPDGPRKLECTWFPASETRDFVTEYINQMFYPRMNWMNRPFIALNAMAVIPSMRNQGIGSRMMSWGIQQAEELNLECWVEASDLGRDLYARFGFQPLMSFAAKMHRRNPSQTWRRLQNEYGQTSGTLMWRPAPNSPSNQSFWEVMAAHVKPSAALQQG